MVVVWWGVGGRVLFKDVCVVVRRIGENSKGLFAACASWEEVARVRMGRFGLDECGLDPGGEKLGRGRRGFVPGVSVGGDPGAKIGVIQRRVYYSWGIECFLHHRGAPAPSTVRSFTVED